MHCIIKTQRQKAWDDGVAPSTNLKVFIAKLSKLVTVRPRVAQITPTPHDKTGHLPK